MDQEPIKMDNETRRFLLREMEKHILDDMAKLPEEDLPLFREQLADVRRMLDQHWELEERE